MNRLEIETPLGSMLLAAKDEKLCGAWFVDQRHFPAMVSDWSSRSSQLLRLAEEQIHAFFNAELTDFSLPLEPRGTAFQRSVWEKLIGIGYAETCSYGQIAQSLSMPSAARAVGAAVGRNPLSLVVPCHRVVGSGGNLTGYAGGLERKQKLLALETWAVSATRPAKTA